MAMARTVVRRIADRVLPAALLSTRYYGNLDAITDSERRALRPIGSSAHEVAVRSGALLAALMALPNVRIFQGVRPADADLPRIPHAINAGRRLLLVESVAWPPGRYVTAANGRIYCDGAYIGQSVRPLLAAIGHWRETLPPGHWVRALVIVHPTIEGELVLPPPTSPDLAWACAHNAISVIQARLPRGRQPVSNRAIAALVAATEEASGDGARPGDRPEEIR
jgi:hypothetical protein